MQKLVKIVTGIEVLLKCFVLLLLLHLVIELENKVSFHFLNLQCYFQTYYIAVLYSYAIKIFFTTVTFSYDDQWYEGQKHVIL